MSKAQFAYWSHTHLTIDVVPGRGAGFSLEAPTGNRFLIRSRLMSDAESTEAVRFLYEHSRAEGNTMRHAWRPGDVVIWDNRCVLHKADHSGVVGDRVLHRGMVAG